jgi:hypothetical protein
MSGPKDFPKTSDSAKKYYSKSKPMGPYSEAKRTGSPGSYIEGQSTKANLKEWADYSLKNSADPSIKKQKLP